MLNRTVTFLNICSASVHIMNLNNSFTENCARTISRIQIGVSSNFLLNCTTAYVIMIGC